MEFSRTSRGFSRYDFNDFNGEKCSLQKSSIAGTMDDDNVEAIWLGAEHETVDKQGRACGARMHLTRAQVAALLPVLNHFVLTGDVSDQPSAVIVPARPRTGPPGLPASARATAERGCTSD